MIAEHRKLNIPIKDEEFDMMYPQHVRKMSKRHFTEVEVAIQAARFLVTKPEQRILDIGSGVGKFCFVAGSYTEAHYTGVDYRKHFIDLCEKLTSKHHFRNVNFIHEDIINIDFKKFDGFYFYNSFEEHADRSARLDHTIKVTLENFLMYSSYLRREFEKLTKGTRVVTYHANATQIPNSYDLISVHFDGLLKCWEKT